MGALPNAHFTKTNPSAPSTTALKQPGEKSDPSGLRTWRATASSSKYAGAGAGTGQNLSKGKAEKTPTDACFMVYYNSEIVAVKKHTAPQRKM